MKRILHLSDPHFGAADPSIATAFLELAATMAPDLTILSGDLTMRARRRELKAAREFVNALPQPRLVIPGNHDIPGMNHPVARFFQGFDRYRSAICDDLEPGLKMPSIHVVSLNSSRAFGIHSDWSEGRLSTRQLVSLREQFQTNPAGSLRILVLHHPLLALQIPGRAVVKPLAGLMQALEDARVDLVMCGHFHRSQLRATGLGGVWKTLISQAPTVCSTRLQGEPQGFHEFQIGEDHIQATHYVFKDKSFVPAGSPAFARLENGWSDAKI